MISRLVALRYQLGGWTDPDVPIAAERPYTGGPIEFGLFNLLYLGTVAFEGIFVYAVVEMATSRWHWANLVTLGLTVMWTGLCIFIWFPMRRLWRHQRRLWVARGGQIRALDVEQRRRLRRLRRLFLVTLAAAAGLATTFGVLVDQPRSPLDEAVRSADSGLFHLSYLHSCSDSLRAAVATAEGPINPAAGSWDLNRATDYTLVGSSLVATPTFSIRGGTSPGTSVRCVQLTSLDRYPLVAAYPMRPTTTHDPNNRSQPIVAFTGAPTLTSRDGVRWDGIAWHQTGPSGSHLRSSVPRGRQIVAYAAGALAVALLILAIVAGRHYLRRRPVVTTQ